MNEITIKTNNFYIIFHDGSHIIVSTDQYTKILNTIDNNDFFEISGNIYKSNSISKVLSETDYKEQYPQKDDDGRIFKDTYPIFDWQKVDSKKALQQMIKGITEFIAGRSYTPMKAIELKTNMEKRLKKYVSRNFAND